VTKFVIGAIGEYDMITTPRMSAMIATRNYLSGWSEENEAEVLNEMLSTTSNDLRLAADIIDEALANEHRAIVGGQEQLSTLGYEPKTIIKI
jgi:Zn-dependent M16 (insulinase) family peptidase